MRKIRLKQKRKLKITNKIFIIIILLLLGIFFFLKYSNDKIFPILIKQAKIDSEKMCIVIIQNSITDEMLSKLNNEKLFNVIKNNNGEVQTIDFNSSIVNKFLIETTNIVSNNLKKLEKGEIEDISFIKSEDYNIKNLKNGVISEIPMGIITNNVLLSNIGPKIPVKINLIGNVVSGIETTVKNYGINSSIVQIFAKVEVTEEVIIPFQTKRVKVVNNIPVAIKIIEGKVPEYYSNGELNKSSSIISLPIEKDN